MHIVRVSDADHDARLNQAAAASSLFDPVIEERTRTIIEAVRARGDAALVEFTQRFDGATLRPEQIPVTQAERMQASLMAGPDLRAAVAESAKNIASFSKRSRRRDWSAKNSHGAQVGEVFQPFQRVGVYIPGGTAPLVSTALMTITLAKVAGCPEIVVCTPCGKDGTLNPALLFAANFAGATEIYRIGGSQAIAAMVHGTETIRPVHKVFGPGNAYVVAAKRLLFGHVSVDLLPGPSETLVLADDSADPRYVAADLLAQAEHGSGHERVWMVTTSAAQLKAVEKEPINVADGKVVLPPKNKVLTSMEELIHQFMIVTQGVNAPAGEVYFGAENPKGELGFYINSRGGGTPYRLKIRAPSFVNLSILPAVLPGHLMSDVVSILGSFDFVMGECDR